MKYLNFKLGRKILSLIVVAVILLSAVLITAAQDNLEADVDFELYDIDGDALDPDLQENAGEADDIEDEGDGGEDEGGGLPLPEYIPTVYTITAFAEFADDIKNQTVTALTPLEDLILPDTLGVSIEYGEEGAQTEIWNVTWIAQPEYTAYVGTYEFTPEIPEGFTLADGVELPVITVEVEPPEIAPYAIGDIYTADDIVAAVKSTGSGDVVLGDDIELSTTLTIARNLTLDLNGHRLTVTVSTGNGIKINSGFTFTIMDSSGNDSGILSVSNTLSSVLSGSGAGINVTGGTLIINSGTVIAQSIGYGAAIGGGFSGAAGNITINGGNVTAQCQYGSGGTCAAIGSGTYGNGGTISITGGIVNAKANNNSSAKDIGEGAGGSITLLSITGGSVFPANGNVTGFSSPRPYRVKVIVQDGGVKLDGAAVSSETFNITTGNNLTSVFTGKDPGVAYLWLFEGENQIRARSGNFDKTVTFNVTTVNSQNTCTIDFRPVVAFSLTANGTANIADTTEIVLNLDPGIPDLILNEVAVSNADKGALTDTSGGDGTKYTLGISNITVAQGGNITVTIIRPDDYTITPSSKSVVVNRRDTTLPVLSDGTANRTSDTAATIGFTSSKVGTAYYRVQSMGTEAPAKPDSPQDDGWVSLNAVIAGANNNKSVTLTAGPQDIYVVVIDAAGNISEPLKIVAKGFITSAKITVASPTTGNTPNYTASVDTGDQGKYTVSTVTWFPAVTGGKFLGSTTYTATVTLTANDGYKFTAVSGTINGAVATVSNSSDSQVTLSRSFSVTSAPTLSGIAVTAQPTKLTYANGGTLDLAGLAVKLTYNDGTTKDVAFANFSANNITASPTHGTLLNLTQHNNQRVTVSCNGQTAATDVLTVNMNDTERVTQDAAALTFDKIKNNNTAANNILSNLTLPTSGDSGSTITWTSNNTLFIGNDGSVTRPSYTDGDKTVILTATVQSGGISETVTITVTVKALWVTGIAVKDQPTKMSYKNGDTLALAGLSVTLNFDNNSTMEVAVANFANYSLTASPSNGEILSLTHDGTRITIMHNNSQKIQATTNTLSVDMTDAEKAAADAAALNFNKISNGNTHVDNVTSDLSLPQNGSAGSTISWSSSDTAFVDNDGKVTRPSYSEGNQQITLTATVTYGNDVETVSITVTVVALDPTDAEMAQEDASALTFAVIANGNPNSYTVTDDLDLPDTGSIHGSAITWQSSDPSVIDNGGMVARPSYADGDKNVILTATVEKNGVTETTTITVMVKALPAPAPEPELVGPPAPVPTSTPAPSPSPSQSSTPMPTVTPATSPALTPNPSATLSAVSPSPVPTAVAALTPMPTQTPSVYETTPQPTAELLITQEPMQTPSVTTSAPGQSSPPPADSNTVDPPGYAEAPGRPSIPSAVELPSEMINETKEYDFGEGSITLAIVKNDDEKSVVTVADTKTAIEAILTADELEQVANGEDAEIQIYIKHLNVKEDVPEDDKEKIENSVNQFATALEGLTMGVYVDIFMQYRVGEGDWVPITEAGDEIELVIDIPQDLLTDGTTYFIVRCHEGITVLLHDLDDDPSTITIRTKLFSTYAIVYTDQEVTPEALEALSKIDVNAKEHKCRLCGFCPEPLGICIFVWISSLIVATVVIVLIVRWKRVTKKR